MITLANKHTRPAVRQMWKTCFNDTEAFMDLYFAEKYSDGNTLVYMENNRAVASLQMLPYTFTFHGAHIPVAYVSGACTLPAFRNRGYMGRLLQASVEVMKQRSIPLSILVPANEHLYQYYERYGYVRVFEKDDAVIPLREIWEEAKGDADVAYQSFNNLFKDRDFCIQKTKADFLTIVKDAALEGFPPKTNLSGMVRVIDAGYRGILEQQPTLNLMLE